MLERSYINTVFTINTSSNSNYVGTILVDLPMVFLSQFSIVLMLELGRVLFETVAVKRHMLGSKQMVNTVQIAVYSVELHLPKVQACACL